MIEKKVSYTTHWEEANKRLKSQGYADVKTGGGDKWNKEVTEMLAKDLGAKVLYVGVTPGYNEYDGVHRFSIEAKNNKEAKGLLSQTDD